MINSLKNILKEKSTKIFKNEMFRKIRKKTEK